MKMNNLRYMLLHRETGKLVVRQGATIYLSKPANVLEPKIFKEFKTAIRFIKDHKQLEGCVPARCRVSYEWEDLGDE